MRPRSLVVTADAGPHRVAAILEKARAIDQNNPLIASNLGLTLARVGGAAPRFPCWYMLQGTVLWSG